MSASIPQWILRSLSPSMLSDTKIFFKLLYHSTEQHLQFLTPIILEESVNPTVENHQMNPKVWLMFTQNVWSELHHFSQILRKIFNFYSLISCDGPAFAFFCPNFVREEDEDTVSLEVHRGIGIHSYTLTKSTGKVVLGIRGMMSPANLPPIIISLIGWKYENYCN